MSKAQQLIDHYGLEPHPEGGWFRETWRAPSKEGERASSTAILFLLKSNERSHWHRVDADEIWLWHQGDPVKLMQSEAGKGTPKSTLLGPGVASGHVPQKVIPAGHWQAAEPQPCGEHGYSLVSCVVAPGFEFDGFELAPQDWRPDA